MTLIIGWLAYIGLMAVHPSHTGGPSLGHIDLNDAVHWTGLIIAPLLAYGYFETSRHLELSRPLPVLALCVMTFSLLAGMGAGVMSGLVQPQISQAAIDGEMSPDLLRALRHQTYWINQGFASIHYALGAIGIGIYGLAWMGRSGGRRIAIGGLAVSGLFLAWLATGTWRPDLHGALFATLAIGAWSIASALAMRREVNDRDPA
ncbi:hypothetical protein [Caulobacter endophyticus]|uniref:DUF4386 family protein n=1 Tax=Caulobacter endophyticus TaxID=2172652 RepID=A0A2T9K9X4_9CAUL|nr:hypothetical protein [Caulobacter endophyticus]PVM92726.1 hypothetical protein DDF67_04980 [Caulobacter endophyticus]